MEAAHTSSSSSITQDRKPTSHGYDLLHSVRKPLYKPWRKPMAPLPPNPTRVYKVKPIEFKDVVQKLTCAPEFQPSRLQTVAPAPLDLNLGGVVRVLPERSSEGNNMQHLSAPAEVKSERVAENYSAAAGSNAMGFALSPSSSAWCSFLLLSPGSMSGLDQSTVL